MSRLDRKAEGAIVIVMQRLHEDDLCGHLLERAPEDWEVVTLPAIAVEDGTFRLSDRLRRVHHRRSGDVLQPAREPTEVLEGLRRQLGSMTFSAQYQQAPVPAGGNEIKRDWLRHYDDADLPETFDRVLASWDTASSLEEGDWSVGTVWGTKGLDFYLLDLVRERLEVPRLRRAIVDLTERWEASATVIEDAGIGRAVAQDLRATGVLRPILNRPRYDKRARLEAQSARFEAGQVHLPREAEWLGSYVTELLAFPFGRHDDQVDSTSQALLYLTQRQVPPRPLVRRNMTRRETTIRR